MARVHFVVLPCLIAAACAAPPPVAPDSSPSLAQAEVAFAAHSVRENMRDAFIAHFASDGVFARGGWVNARAALADRPAPPIVLDWRPAYVLTAASGDIGLSTGPWKRTSRLKPDDPAAFGQFVSIWRREAGGDWMVVVDGGVSHGEPELWTAPLEATTVAAERVSTSVEESEARLAVDAARDGLLAAYRRHGSRAMRVLREGEAPAIGKEPAVALAARTASSTAWNIEEARVARSRDLAYVRGTLGGREKPAASFVRVWVAEDGAWRIVLDVLIPSS